MVSGASRLLAAIVVTCKLFFGAAIGTLIADGLWSILVVVKPLAPTPFYTWVFLALLLMGLAMVFQVRPRDIFLPLMVGLLTWGGVRLLAPSSRRIVKIQFKIYSKMFQGVLTRRSIGRIVVQIVWNKRGIK